MPVKSVAPEAIRNVALVGHGGCGKTCLAEALLFATGVTSRLGRTDNQTSILDYEPEEQARGCSVGTSLAWIEHGGVKVNVLDTPGDQNFIFDSLNAMRGADAVLLVISAPDGVEVQTESVFHEATALGLPKVAFLTKMDRERADFERTLKDIEDSLGIKPLPVQVPIGRETAFTGVVDLFEGVAWTWPGDASGKATKGPVPDDLKDEVELARANLVESVASTDDALLEKYLETFELSEEEIRGAFKGAVRAGSILPVLYGAGTRCTGAQTLLDLIAWAFPSPLERHGLVAKKGDQEVPVAADPAGPFVAQVIHTSIDEQSGKTSLVRVFAGRVPADGAVLNAGRGASERLASPFGLRGKERELMAEGVCGDILGVAKLKDSRTGDTLTDPKAPLVLPLVQYPSPMMSYVIHPATKSDEDRLKGAVERLIEEDPTLSVIHEETTHQMVLRGMGQAHLDLATQRMQRKYKVSVTTDLPPVPYRETIKKAAMNVEGKHKKQTGGSGQFGVCYINVEPLPKDSGFEFVDAIRGGSIPRQFIPSVEKGIRERLKRGFYAGYPITDFRVSLVDGKYHPVDSKDVAFQMAGSKALKAAFAEGGTRLLEPIVTLEIVAPSESVGGIMGDITGRRGRVQGMEPRGKNTVVKAICPLAEVLRYAPDLRSMTGGKGSFTMAAHGYEEVPPHLVSKVVESSPFKVREAVEED